MKIHRHASALTIILALYFSNSAISRAEDSAKDALDAALKNQREVEKLLAPPQNNCDPSGASASSPRDPCVDLFKAACTNEDGSFKDAHKLENQIDKKIQAAREAALKQMGSDSVDAAYIDYLKKNGFTPKSDLDEEQKKKLLSGETPSDLGDWFENVPKDCYGVAKLKPDEETKVNQLRNDFWQKQNQVTSAQSNLDYAQKQIESAKQQKAATTDKNSQKYYDQQIEELGKKIPQLQADLETKKKDYESAQDKVDAIYTNALTRGREALSDFRKRVAASYEKDYTGLVSTIMQMCSDSLPKSIGDKKKQLKDKEKELADKAAATASANNSSSSSGSTEVINEELKKLEVPGECSKNNLYAIREAAVQLYRIKDKEKSKQEVKSFVEKNFDLYLKLKGIEQKLWNTQLTTYVYSGQSQPQTPARKDLSQDLSPLQNDVNNACNDFKSRSWNTYREAYGKFFGNIAKSKPAIESILGATYGPEQKTRMDAMYKQIHSGIMQFIDKDLGSVPELKGTPKLQRMKDSMAALGYSWIDKPAATLYKKEDDFPLPVLDFDKLPMTEMFLWAFQDPTMSFFKEMNAFYNPAMKQGVLTTDEKVNLLPAINLLTKDDPYAAMAVIAHEIGHKIGYQVSKINGYDLTKVYSKLVDCLSSEKSINMLNYQADEAIADWISAKVMGRMIMNLPQAERKPAALRLGGFFCQAYGDDFYKAGVYTKSGHPETTLRINGVFGANTDVRSALGCAGDKAKGPYQECQIAGVAK